MVKRHKLLLFSRSLVGKLGTRRSTTAAIGETLSLPVVDLTVSALDEMMRGDIEEMMIVAPLERRNQALGAQETEIETTTDTMIDTIEVRVATEMIGQAGDVIMTTLTREAR